MKNNFVITLARQYGCGGRTVGKLLAEKLGIGYYDTDLIKLAAEKNGVSPDFYKEFDEKATSKFASMFGYSTAVGSFYSSTYMDMVINDKVFFAQSEVIKEVAQKPCVIVGRCADYVLDGKDNLVKIFLHADMDARRDRIVNKYGIKDVKNIDKYILKADKRRAQYYNSYTDREWGEVKNYDLTINTSKLSLEKVAEIILKYLEKLEDKIDG